MLHSVFEFQDYKNFLKKRLEFEEKLNGRGAKKRLTDSIPCHSAYLNQVLTGKAQFSLDQGEAINSHFGHTEAESEYFIHLINFSRAGTKALQARIQKSINNLLKNHSTLAGKLDLQKTSLPPEDEIIYMLNWYFGAIYSLITIPEFQTPEKISKRLGIPLKYVSEALAFLEKTSLISRLENGYQKNSLRMSIGIDNPLLKKRMQDFRLRSLREIEKPTRNSENSLIYSSTLTVSEEDSQNIRDILIDAIKTKIAPIASESNDEKACLLNIDFFEV